MHPNPSQGVYHQQKILLRNTKAYKLNPPNYLATPKSLKQVTTNTNESILNISPRLHHTNSPSKVLQESSRVYFHETLVPSHMDSNPVTSSILYVLSFTNSIPSSIFQVLSFKNPSTFLPCINTSIKTRGKFFFKTQMIQSSLK